MLFFLDAVGFWQSAANPLVKLACRLRITRDVEASERARSTSLTLATVIRGTEWRGKTAKDRSVQNTLRALGRVVGFPNLLVLVDTQARCGEVPASFDGIRCHGLERCADAVYGAPSMKCIFQILLDEAKTEHVGYINGDMIIFRDFLETLAVIAREHDHFMMVGRRRNSQVAVVEAKSYDDDSQTWRDLETKACSMPLDGGGAMDYFVLPKSHAEYLRHIPPFIIGNWRWDNVVLSTAVMNSEIAVVDATLTVTAVHQGTDEIERRENRPASVHNHALAMKHMGRLYRLGSVKCADYASYFSLWRKQITLKRKTTLTLLLCKGRAARIQYTEKYGLPNVGARKT